MNYALIVAGGSGKRFGNIIPKQFLLVNNRPLLFYTVEAFNKVKEIDGIILVVHKDYVDEVEQYRLKYNLNKIIMVTEGGETRQESVFKGLEAIKSLGGKDNDIILIHDGARPLIDEKIIINNINECKKYGAVETAIVSTDTIVKSKDGETISSVENRNELFSVQTPQTFTFKIIYEAHEKNQNNDASDDAQLVRLLNHEVRIVKGNKLNFKITTQEDLELFKSIKNCER